jgi:hypothetical protein
MRAVVERVLRNFELMKGQLHLQAGSGYQRLLYMAYGETKDRLALLLITQLDKESLNATFETLYRRVLRHLLARLWGLR